MRVLLIVAAIALGCSEMACSSGKTASHQMMATDTASKSSNKGPNPIKYSFYLRVDGSMKTQPDEVFIDTTGQMTFNTQQRMKAGNWKTPTGFAYIEAVDDDTLFNFISHNSLFELSEDDVKPQCPNGDQLFLMIYRNDINKKISFRTNSCAEDFNLLSGEQRKYFPQFIAFCMRLRDRYRPKFPEQ